MRHTEEGEPTLTNVPNVGSAGVDHVGKKHGKATPSDTVKKLIKAGKVKKKCCRSDDRCKRCPVLALKRAKAEFKKAA
jgi:hypothetical protein